MNISTNTSLVTLAGILIALACSAHAEEQEADEKPDKAAFESIDTNQDGEITVQEAWANNEWLAQNFNSVDVNSNGRITRAEFDKAMS